MNLLIVEDELTIREVLSTYFTQEGWNVYTASDGMEALKQIKTFNVDVVLLDLMIPKLPGEEVCIEIRKTSNVPIIVISSKSKEEDLINGLDIGADDYITKPFRIKEVIARINAILRRIEQFTKNETNILYFNNRKLMINFDTQEVFIDNTLVKLTSTEFKILGALVKSPGKVFSRHDLSYVVLGYRHIGDGRMVDAHIKNLRKKLEENPKEPQYIQTKIGSGYKFNSRYNGVNEL